mgnify:CR=1 FL=1
MEPKGGKGEIEMKLENFVKKSFNECNIDLEKDNMKKDQAKELIKNLMKKYGHEEAWDEDEFERMFDLF